MKYICTKQDDDPDGEPGIEEMFLFPASVDFSDIAPLLNIIRNQTYGNWVRIKRKEISTGDVNKNIFVSTHISSDDLLTLLPTRAQKDADLYKKQLQYGCKYIVVNAHISDDDLIKEIYVFPKDVHHDCFYEAINNQDEYREIVSAGFVDSDLNCHGSSETLGVKSRPEDTKLLKKEMSI